MNQKKLLILNWMVKEHHNKFLIYILLVILYMEFYFIFPFFVWRMYDLDVWEHVLLDFFSAYREREEDYQKINNTDLMQNVDEARTGQRPRWRKLYTKQKALHLS